MAHLPSPPFVDIAGIANFRDAGGEKTSSGRHVVTGLIFRSADPSKATEAGLQKMSQELGSFNEETICVATDRSSGIKAVFDLRSLPEIRRQGPEWANVEADQPDPFEPYGMKRYWVPVFATDDYGPEQIALRYKEYTRAGTQGFVKAYTDILSSGTASYSKIFRHLAAPNPQPCLYHCTAGKDRTGVLTALLLLLAGVENDVIAEEYSLTTAGLEHLRPLFIERLLKNPALEGNGAGVQNMVSSKKENMLASIEMIETRFGGAEGYLRDYCRLKDDEIELLRRNLVQARLSEPLKALINAAQFRPNTTPAPQHIASVYERIARDAATKRVGLPAWLSASTAASMTLNSPDSLLKLYGQANSEGVDKLENHPVFTAELMREVGLKCIGFNGVPRTINCLNAFRDGLPHNIQEALKKRQPRRRLSSSNVDGALSRGQWLWNSIYHPFTDKLTAKLASSHPDLPVHIIESEYGTLFSDPAETDKDPAKIGRVLTSVVAVACLRAQTGVGPQVISHVFGLRKAFEDGSADKEEPVQGGKWLASDEGSLWLLESTDRIVEALSGKDGTNFAPGYKAKL